MNTRKERFSLAYINAVATYADCDVLEPRVDRGSVDGILKRTAISETIGFQAKATSRNVMSSGGDALRFPLPIRDYNNLRVEKHPFILIVVLLPDEETEWLTQTDDKLCLRRCGYWLSLVGHNPVPNRNGVTVRIPKTNVFSSAQLTDMMDKVARGETL